MLIADPRTSRLLAMALSMAVVLLPALPAQAVPVPYHMEVQTGAGKVDGTVTMESKQASWDLKLEDTNKEDGACVYARIKVDRPTPPDNVFKSKDACFGEPVHFTGKDPHGNKGLTLEFCSDDPDATPECVRVPTRLVPHVPRASDL